METSHPSLQATVHLPGCLTLHNNNMGPERCLHLSEKESFRHWGLMSFYASWRKGTYSLLGGAELPRTLRHQRPKTHKPYCCCLALSCVLLFCDPIDCSPPGSFFFFFFFLCDPIESSPPGCPVPGILQARTLEWVAISFSIGSSVYQIFLGRNTGVDCHFLLQGYSWPRDRTQISCIADVFFTTEPLGKPHKLHWRWLYCLQRAPEKNWRCVLRFHLRESFWRSLFPG